MTVTRYGADVTEEQKTERRARAQAAKRDRIERDTRGLKLLGLGLTYQAVADYPHNGGKLYNGNRANAYKALSKLLVTDLNEAREIAVESMVNQYDTLFAALGKDIQRADVKAINAAAGILDKKARLLGLYEPVKIDTMGGTVVVQFNEKLTPPNPDVIKGEILEIDEKE